MIIWSVIKDQTEVVVVVDKKEFAGTWRVNWTIYGGKWRKTIIIIINERMERRI